MPVNGRVGPTGPASVRLVSVTPNAYDEAYEHWHMALRSLTSGTVELTEWQERRFRFAHSLGALLTTGSDKEGSPVTGPVVYGVYLSGVGLAYVGQTLEAERRLRDLPIGESHHLANTIPPELWERVVVVQWPSLSERLDYQERKAVADMGPAVCGLALEHLLQVRTEPPLNRRRRTRDGLWRLRRPEDSRSRGALFSGAIPGLHVLVWSAWNELERAAVPSCGEKRTISSSGRVIFPSAVLEQGTQHSHSGCPTPVQAYQELDGS